MGQKPKIKTPKVLIKGAVKYLDHCAKSEDLPTITGLALWLGVHRDTLYDTPKRRPEFQETIRKIRQLMMDVYEQRLVSAENPAGIIFAMKNLFGWKDERTTKTETVNLELSASLSDMLEYARKQGKKPHNVVRRA